MPILKHVEMTKYEENISGVVDEDTEVKMEELEK